jgi:hypothetical protein
VIAIRCTVAANAASGSPYRKCRSLMISCPTAAWGSSVAGSDVDRLERILGSVAGDDDYDRLTLITHARGRAILRCADPSW